jgi:hypothetical protein
MAMARIRSGGAAGLQRRPADAARRAAPGGGPRTAPAPAAGCCSTSGRAAAAAAPMWPRSTSRQIAGARRPRPGPQPPAASPGEAAQAAPQAPGAAAAAAEEEERYNAWDAPQPGPYDYDALDEDEARARAADRRRRPLPRPATAAAALGNGSSSLAAPLAQTPGSRPAPGRAHARPSQIHQIQIRIQKSKTYTTRTPQVDARVDDAAGFICAVDDLRPLDRETYNPAYEIWERIRRVPPAARRRVLEGLEPGGVRALWRNSVGRYALDDERSAALFSDFALSDDFPTAPGQARARG